MKHKTLYTIVLIFILLLSFYLRVYKLGSKPVWYDEAVSISNAEKPLSSYFVSYRLNYKPVYFLLLNKWISIFGEDAFNLRFFSLIWGVLAVLLIYKLADFMFNKEIGLTSAFLLGMSVFHIFHCQQIRHFSLILFLTLVSVFYLLKFEKENKTIYLFNLTVANILIINTHPYGFNIILIEWIFGIYALRKKTLRYWFFCQLILALFILWWLMLPSKTHIKEMTFWIQKPDFSSLVETFDTLSWGGPRYGLDDFKINSNLLGLTFLLSYVYLVLFFLGLILEIREEDKRKLLFLSLWLILPILIIFLLSSIRENSVYAIKHFIIILPAFIIIIAKGLFYLKKILRVIILIAIISLSILPLKILYDNYFSTDWKKSTEYVKRFTKEGDVIILSTLHEIVNFIYYFRDHRPSLWDIDIYGKITKDSYKNNIFLTDNNILVICIKQTEFGDKKITAEQDFKNKVVNNPLIKNKTVWVMLSHWTGLETKYYIFNYLDKNFRRVKCDKFQGLEVCQFNPLNKN